MTTTPEPEPTEERRNPAESDLAPLYAVAGLADVVAETVRKTLAEQAERAARRRAELSTQARANADELRQRLGGLPDSLRTLPSATRTRAQELQAQAESLYAQVSAFYAELANRGKSVLDGAAGSASAAADSATEQAEEVLDDVAEQVEPVVEVVQDDVSAAGEAVADTLDPTQPEAQPGGEPSAEDPVTVEEERAEVADAVAEAVHRLESEADGTVAADAVPDPSTLRDVPDGSDQQQR